MDEPGARKRTVPHARDVDEERDIAPKRLRREEEQEEENEMRRKTRKTTGQDTMREVVTFVLLTCLSLFTRFWKIQHPPAIVFDEVHFVSMAQWYSARKYFFDIHPPLAKLVLAGIATLVGFHTDVPYREIETAFTHDGYIAMRMWQAFCGAMLPPVAYLTLRHGIGVSYWGSLLSASFIILELSFQTISRAVLLDSFLYLTMALGFLFALKMWNWRLLDDTTPRLQRPGHLRFWFWATLTGISIGACFAIKHTGLGIVGIVGLVHIILMVAETFSPDPVKKDKKQKPLTIGKFFEKIAQMFETRYFWSGVWMIVIIVAIYIGAFVVHFTVIKNTGVDEDSMNDNYRSQLIGSNITMPEGEEPQGMLRNIIDINLKMLEINSATMYDHYYNSRFWEWPFMYRGIVYYWKHLPDGYHECVYLFGNPFIYWTALISTLLSFFLMDRYFHLFFSDASLSRRQKNLLFAVALCVLGFLANYMPYMLVKRPTYLYHYHPSLYFGILLCGLVLDAVFGTNPTHLKQQFKVSTVLSLISIALLSYLFFLPFSFATPLNDAEHDARRLFKSFFPLW